MKKVAISFITVFKGQEQQRLSSTCLISNQRPSTESSTSFSFCSIILHWTMFFETQTPKSSRKIVCLLCTMVPLRPQQVLFVSMWLVHLARLLQLKSVTQKSFAEYHSKRNLVEHVRAVHNHTLSNEQFSSNGVHSDYEISDTSYQENMEHMAEKVKQC